MERSRRGAGVPADLAGVTVLLVEDDAIIALDLETGLRELGCTVIGPAATVNEALTLLRDHRPRVALLDLGLRDGPATPVAAALNAAGVPFVLVTGYNPSDLDAPALRGAPRLVKPFDLEALAPVLRALLPPRLD
jgi:DNA-binding response OmpR family regulator